MGCGKSSVGRRLSELLCCPFMDLDNVIEQQTGRSIPEIFATDGEAAFRQMEMEVLTTIVCTSPSVFGKLNAPLAPSHSKAAGPFTDPAAAGCSQKRSTGPFSGKLATLPGVGKCQFRTSVSQTSDHELILSLGGGTVTQERCAELVKENTACIYLRASVNTLVERLSDEAAGRPMLKGADLRTRIETLMAQRSAIYESTADHIIDTDGLSINEVAQSITRIII